MNGGMNDRIDALESLIVSHGWGYLAKGARLEWAERERRGVKSVIGKDSDDAIEKLRQIVAAREAIEWVLEWPNEQIAQLRRQEAQPEAASPVRAPVAPVVLAHSRRGGL